jgi:GNAT superfamily N-acetyltransferase
VSTGPVRVEDCERVQTGWFRRRAEAFGGEAWADGAMTWTDGPDGLNLMFPRAITREGVERGLARARGRNLGIVGAWLGLEVDPTPLAEAGFEEGWSPCWMAADLASLEPALDPRITLDPPTGESALPEAWRALTRAQPPRAWYATASAGSPAQVAGQAWSFLAGELAGVFDMDVREPFRRQGLGTGLLIAVCAAARAVGGRHAVLNATPDGKALYRTRGFTQIGEGITWWHHMGRACASP